MTPTEPFVDIHCHLLPGIDDGAEDWDTSIAMARIAVADGFQSMVVTPHQLGSYGQNSGDEIRALTKEFQQCLDTEAIPLRVQPGADVRIDDGMVDLICRGDVLTLGDHRRHVLLELPHELYLPLDGLLDELASQGIVGILSHPERNRGILRNPQVVRPLVEAGCLMQVTADSISGAFGGTIQQFAESMLRQGLVHLVATDAHGVKSRRPTMRRAFDRIRRLIDELTAIDLCCRNPAAIADGQAVHAGIRKVGRRSLRKWLRWAS